MEEEKEVVTNETISEEVKTEETVEEVSELTPEEEAIIAETEKGELTEEVTEETQPEAEVEEQTEEPVVEEAQEEETEEVSEGQEEPEAQEKRGGATPSETQASDTEEAEKTEASVPHENTTLRRQRTIKRKPKVDLTEEEAKVAAGNVTKLLQELERYKDLQTRRREKLKKLREEYEELPDDNYKKKQVWAKIQILERLAEPKWVEKKKPEREKIDE